jgi:hypothetical protein
MDVEDVLPNDVFQEIIESVSQSSVTVTSLYG